MARGAGVLSLLFLIPTLAGCSGAAVEREPSRAIAMPVKPVDLPWPETAFTDDHPSPVPPAAPPPSVDRFATRRIGRAAPGPAPAHHGPAVDLDLRAADLHDVFRLLADVGRVNVVVSGEVSGKVTMRLRKVPWDQALDLVARLHGLVYEREGNVILVHRPATVASP